jgi:hypothetical protein
MSTGSISHWHDHRSYEYISDSNDIVPIHRLLAYLEHGRRIFGDETIVHHEINRWVNTPDSLSVLTQSDHVDLHEHGEWAERDGIPHLRQRGETA